MAITVGAEDISSIEIHYREHSDMTDGYAVVHLREHIPDVKVFHFTFSMRYNDFVKQVSKLEASSKESGYLLDMKKKSLFILGLEKMMVGALAGTEYQSYGCPSCRMIDAFISSERYTT